MKYARNGNGTRGLTLVRALLLAAAIVIVVVVGYRQIRRLTETRLPVWVSASALTAGEVVAAGTMRMIEMLPPSGAIVNRANIVGRALLADKAEGEPFLASDLAPRPAGPALSTTIPEGRLLATLRFASMDLPAPELRAGDRIDVLLAATDGVHVVAHDAYVLGLLNQRTPPGGNGDSGVILGVDISIPGANGAAKPGSALVLGLHPEEVFSLAAAEATGRSLKLVLHASREVETGELIDLRPGPVPLDPPELPTVELMLGSRSEMVSVR
jgi:Flp pilus assembly protein CpaB